MLLLRFVRWLHHLHELPELLLVQVQMTPVSPAK